MSSNDSEDEALDDLEFDGSNTEGSEDGEDILNTLETDLMAIQNAEEASEVDDDSDTDDSDAGSDDDDDDEDQRSSAILPEPLTIPTAPQHHVPPDEPNPFLVHQPHATSITPSPASATPPKAPTPELRRRSVSPAHARIAKILADTRIPRSYQVEAICAIPHPVPTHSLAASLCMTHLITGSDDGYIRNYDIFSSVNGKLFLTAPQRHHCGVMEGVMKAAQLRCWWENPASVDAHGTSADDSSICPPYSLLMHSDALWCLAGTDQGHINLFTVRHDPGRLIHVMNGHRAPVSSMTMNHDEKAFFSAGWDSEAFQWDLNTGQIVRNFKSHGSQLTAIAVRPLLPPEYHGQQWGQYPMPELRAAQPPRGEELAEVQTKSELMDVTYSSANQPSLAAPAAPPTKEEDDTKSDTSFDPLFDDEPEGDADFSETNSQSATQPAAPQPAPAPAPAPPPPRRVPTAAIAPKNAPPILDAEGYNRWSPDILMVASIDGQVVLWDKRVHSPGTGVGRLWMSEGTPPWCVSACWSSDGSQIYAGRRNGAIDIWDVRQMGSANSGTPRIWKTLRNPVSSGVVSCVVAFPDGRHLACASNDNIRLWNVAEANEPDASGKMKSGVQFKIIPGHHGGFISQMLVDRAARFLVTASSNRGWFGESTRTVFVHEIKHLY